MTKRFLQKLKNENVERNKHTQYFINIDIIISLFRHIQSIYRLSHFHEKSDTNMKY